MLMSANTSGEVPHVGYHGQGRPRNFFEGWYFRITIPEIEESFAFMYSIEDPRGNSDRSGGMMQVLGPGDRLVWRSLPDCRLFWGARERLALGHWGRKPSLLARRSLTVKELPPDQFERAIPFGYQVSDSLNQGKFRLPSGESIRWRYRVDPLVKGGWRTPDATMGWLSYFPVFEPGWQILMDRGLATGYVIWRDRSFNFERVPAYAEKNWGGAFPIRWFWMQCNGFENRPNLAITCVGGIRKVLGWPQSVGMVYLQWDRHTIKLMPEASQQRWSVSPWGEWLFVAQDSRYRLEVLGLTDEIPVPVMVPTHAGMQFNCWDTTHGYLRVRVWQWEMGTWTLVLEESSSLAGLEVGGDGWDSPWNHPQ